MSCNSAVLDVVSVNKDVSTILRNSYDHSNIYSASTMDNSLVQSPSMESFSTMHDIENLSELTVDDNSDLCVRIDNPQKHLDTLETYITFRLTTKVARIEFEEHEYIVRRRYNDFLWLRMKLNESHPFCIIPPLPAKHSLLAQLDRYSKDFILGRMKALNCFIYRVVQHPILSCTEHFKIFITAKHADFSHYRKLKLPSSAISHPSTPTSIQSTNNSCAHLHPFTHLKLYLTSLSDKLTALERISSRVAKERGELVAALQGYYPVYMTWAGLEGEVVGGLLQGISTALERSTRAQQQVAMGGEQQQRVREILQYIEVVQNTVQKRDNYQAVYESAMGELSKKRVEKDKLIAESQQSTSATSTLTPTTTTPNVPERALNFFRPSSSSHSHDDRLQQLGARLPSLVAQAELHHDRLTCADEQLRSDVTRWQRCELRPLVKEALLALVDAQLEFYERSAAAWEAVTSSLATTTTPAATSGI